VLRTGNTVRTESVTAPRFARREERCVPGRYVSDETPFVNHHSSCGFNYPSKRPVAVSDMNGFVVDDALAQAMPQDLEPAVAESAKRSVVRLALGAFAVVELPGPTGACEAAEGPALDCVPEEVVVSEAASDHELRLAGSASHRRLAGVALERVRRLELLGVISDLTGDPGGEAVTEARKAQVDLAARKALPPLVLPRLLPFPRRGAPSRRAPMRRSQALLCWPIASSWVAASLMVSALARTR